MKTITEQLLLVALESLSEIALRNIVQADNLPKEVTHLFGHKVILSAIDQQALVISRKKQVIEDWKAATNQIKQLFEQVPGLENPIVVPLEVFNKTCRICQLIRFEDLKNEAEKFVSLLNIDRFMMGQFNDFYGGNLYCKPFSSWEDKYFKFLPSSEMVEYVPDVLSASYWNKDSSFFIDEDFKFNEKFLIEAKAYVGIVLKKRTLN